ncbi:hypothetical protein AAFN75_16825 [Algibacter sp. AS12]|uniref:hypothetical protein n=1 Tax=Algibacter sp. AS12 TaxID=3135773 RepID=UPI00398B033B
MKTHIIKLVLILLSGFAVAQQHEQTATIKPVSMQTEYEVGSPIVLKFPATKAVAPLLYCSNSYGSTLISGNRENQEFLYKLPDNISKKIGLINWRFLDTKTPISGNISITPKAEIATMETYIGPPSIEAGGTDYTMLVVIPTDSLDNPVPNNTAVHANFQFLDSEEKEAILTNNLIAFKNINSKKESGRILVSSESLGINSKEFTINVSAAIPTNFRISAIRPHDYADGNQITTFSTSIIKDRHNNVVSDGTFVTFIITNAENNILKTTGTTIDGVATSKIIHPDFKDQWRITAFVDGMAESNGITLNYKQVIKDFEVSFSNNNRTIRVGPLQSFMEQMIPDGLQVKLLVFKGDTLFKTLTKTSFNGYANFTLKPAIFENETYNFELETAGKTKVFKSKKLW